MKTLILIFATLSLSNSVCYAQSEECGHIVRGLIEDRFEVSFVVQGAKSAFSVKKSLKNEVLLRLLPIYLQSGKASSKRSMVLLDGDFYGSGYGRIEQLVDVNGHWHLNFFSEVKGRSIDITLDAIESIYFGVDSHLDLQVALMSSFVQTKNDKHN